MLSSSPAVPLHSIDFHDNDTRRLSLRTHGGQEYLTAHDGLPSPEHLTPISGTPRAMTPESLSRRASDLGDEMDKQRDKERERLRSDTLGFEEHSKFGTMSHLNRAPSRRTAAANQGDQVSSIFVIPFRTSGLWFEFSCWHGMSSLGPHVSGSYRTMIPLLWVGWL
jgi:hypothetical protein